MTIPRAPASRAPIQTTILIALAIILLLTCIDPPYPGQMLLQHIPTVAVLIAAPFLLRRRPLGTASVLCLALFLLFHIIGARYIYSFVPYDALTETLFGFSITETFGFERNHYDRLVHFLFGALWIAPVREIAIRYGNLSPRAAMIAALGFVLSISALYEIFEWCLTFAVAPEDAEAYNGQQGDLWDAQKDMALAAGGAVVAAGICWGVGSRE